MNVELVTTSSFIFRSYPRICPRLENRWTK